MLPHNTVDIQNISIITTRKDSVVVTTTQSEVNTSNVYI